MSVPVSVDLAFDHRARSVAPKRIVFDGREYEVGKVGFHHTFRDGRTLYHVFSVASKAMFFRLVLNTETLAWRLEEVADGEAD